MSALLAQSSQPLIRWDWIGTHLDDIWAAAEEHLFLTIVPVLLGIVISFLLTALVLRFRWLQRPIIELAGILYTIPALAAFALMLAFVSLFSNLTAIVPLTTYTILILVRNMLAGIDSVPDEVTESALGMGLRPRQILLRVQVPLSLPVIVAGIRIATVTVVGLVTVTALIGKGGFGDFILDSFRRSIFFPTEAFVGTAGSVVIAVVLDALLFGLGLLLAPWERRAGAG